MSQINAINGVHYYKVNKYHDSRGFLSKTYSTEALFANPLVIAESFFTLTKKGVIRGMHLQINQAASDRVISVIKGRIFDVLIDLRENSPSFTHINTIELSCEDVGSVFVPKGVAHGFQALDESITHYVASTNYSEKLDVGVNVNSINVNWPLPDPIISDRDLLLPDLKSFLLKGYGIE
jgi:dTDP-4-dehydrorhamnose 3,5-epimerase